MIKPEYIIERHKVPGRKKDITVFNYTPRLTEKERKKEKMKIEELLYEVFIKYQT
jgi:hypothetical protein